MAIQSPTETPFTILFANNEQAEYTFEGITGDDGEPIYVYTEKVYLKTGDYTLKGMESQITIERKSHIDFLGSIGGGRDRLQREFQRMNEMEFAAIVVEADWNDLLFVGNSNSQMAAKTISRTITSWSIRYPTVHWFLCTSRRHAELMTFRLLDRFWNLKANKEI